MTTTSPTHQVSIPSQVCFDTTLSASAKLLYGELIHCCRPQGYCKLNNQYFAKRYQVTPKTVVNWIARLEEAGYLRIRFDESGQQRLLYLNDLTEEEPITNQTSLAL